MLGFVIFDASKAQTAERTIDQLTGNTLLLRVTHFGQKLQIESIIDGKVTAHSDYLQSFAEPALFIIPSTQTNSRRITLHAKVQPLKHSNSDIQIEAEVLPQDMIETYTKIFTFLDKWDPSKTSINELNTLLSLLQIETVKDKLKTFVQHQLVLKSMAAHNWPLTWALSRQIRTNTDRRLLLQCHILNSYLNNHAATDNELYTDALLEGVSTLAKIITYHYRTQGDLPKQARNALSKESYKVACNDFLTSSQIAPELTDKRFQIQTRTINDDANALFVWLLSHLNKERAFDNVKDKIKALELSNTYANLWYFYNFIPDHHKAAEFGKKAIALLNRYVSEDAVLVELYNNVYQSLLKTGYYAEARQMVNASLNLKGPIAAEKKSEMLVNKGSIYRIAGEYDVAVRYYRQALTVLYAASTQLEWNELDGCTYRDKYLPYIARTLVRLGIVLQAQDKLKEANKHYTCAAALLNQLAIENKADYFETVLSNARARLALQNGNLTGARVFSELALNDQRSAGVTRIDALLIQLKLSIQKSKDRFSAPVNCTSKPDQSDIRCKLAEMFSLPTFYASDIDTIDIEDIHFPTKQMAVLAELVRLHSALNQPRWVNLFTQRGLAILAREQQQVSNMQAWKAARFDFIQMLVDDLIRETALPQNKKLSRLFDLLEKHYSLEPKSEQYLFFSTAVDSPRTPNLNNRQPLTHQSLSEIQKKLTKDELFLRFFISQKQSFALYVSSNLVGIKRIDELQKVNKLIEHNRLVMTNSNAAELASFSIFGRLFPRSFIKQGGFKKIIIVPDGKLHELPFSMLNIALQKGNYKPLAEDIEIVLTPSANSYFAVKDSSHGHNSGFDISIFANPLLSHNASAISPELNTKLSVLVRRPLPATELEADTIRTLFSHAKLNIGTKQHATSQFLMQTKTRHSQLLHIATHGFFVPDAKVAIGLITAPDPTDSGKSDGIFDFDQLMSAPVGSKLVVLSGCETSLGKLYKGSGMRSMTRGFLAQGAGSVISTLWPVEDRATAEFMQRFYQQLAETNNSSKALQAAKKSMYMKGRYRHPKYWAAFVLTSTNKQHERLFI